MEIKEVNEEMIGAVKEFLANREEFQRFDRWDGLFNYRWKPKKFPYGFVAMDKEKIVAFIGTIFSERVIAGEKVNYCNMTTWFVDAQHRSLIGLMVIKHVSKMQDVLITSLTPNDNAKYICEKMGFKSLEEEQIVSPILPSVRSFLPWRSGTCLISFDKNEILQHLNEADRVIFEDHQFLPCAHFLIKEIGSGRYCYGIGTTSPIRRLNFLKGQWLNLCHLSDKAVFVENIRHFKRELWKGGRFLLLRYDVRLLSDGLSLIELKEKRARQFKFKDMASSMIDNIYSELVTFNKY